MAALRAEATKMESQLESSRPAREIQRRYRIATYALLSGVLLAAIVFWVTYGLYVHSEQRLAGLQGECRAHAPLPQRLASRGWFAPAQTDQPICDIDLIEAAPFESLGPAQERLIQADEDNKDLSTRLWSGPFTILLLFAAPWLWFFFLSRLEELRPDLSRR